MVAEKEKDTLALPMDSHSVRPNFLSLPQLCDLINTVKMNIFLWELEKNAI